MNIILASDHNGVQLKSKLFSILREAGHSPIDLGPYNSESSVDYVDFAYQASRIVAAGSATRAILICGTGVGMSIVANRVPGARASLVHNIETSEKTREHNDSNILCLGSWINEDSKNIEIVNLWLEKTFGEGRHNKRIVKIDPVPGLVIANGVFDVLHKGHLDLLKFAKSCGSKLIIAIDSDERVKQLKGPDRPINNQNFRREILLSMRNVDEVIVFNNEQELRDIIKSLMPEVVVKGGEWTADDVRRRDQIPDQVRVITLPLTSGFSTTDQLRRIRELGTHEKVSASDR